MIDFTDAVIKQYDGAQICGIYYDTRSKEYYASIISNKKSSYEDESVLVHAKLEYCVDRMKVISKLKAERNII